MTVRRPNISRPGGSDLMAATTDALVVELLAVIQETEDLLGADGFAHATSEQRDALSEECRFGRWLCTEMLPEVDRLPTDPASELGEEEVFLVRAYWWPTKRCCSSTDRPLSGS